MLNIVFIALILILGVAAWPTVSFVELMKLTNMQPMFSFVSFTLLVILSARPYM